MRKQQEHFIQFAVKAPKELKEAFFDACYENDRHASQVIREFMKKYVKEHQGKA